MKKNNKIRVYLQYPLGFPDCSYYKTLIQFPPSNVQFLHTGKNNGEIVTKSYYFKFLSRFKGFVRDMADLFLPGIPNAHRAPSGEYEVIHGTHCLIKNSTPWVADIEAPWQLWISHKKDIARVKRILESDACKKLFPWTMKTYHELVALFPSLKEKFEVVYPATPVVTRTPKSKKEFVVLFSGRNFFQKGGLHAVAVIDALTKKYPHVRGIVNSAVPAEIIKKYASNKKLTFYPLLPQKEVFSLYDKTHLLVYPGYTDSFGFAYLEAMAYGLPIITVDGDSRREIITPGKNGFIIPRPKKFSYETIGLVEENIIQQMIDKASIIIEKKSLWNTLSKHGIREIEEGKFSIKTRNAQLARIYREAAA